MESQESDLCNPEEMELILSETGIPNLNELMHDQIGDWSAVPVPVVNPTGELPSRNPWDGEHLFDSKVDLSGNYKKNYVFSSKLNRLYVDMDKVVPFQMKWDGSPGLNVRALMVFTTADRLKTPVKRCTTHRDKDNPVNDRYEHSEHVLATENDFARYEVDETSKRCSVVVPLNLQQGCDHALINYKFMCKTSCTAGLNRSPTDVVFTLEDAGGQVLGRQVIGVKICSCPKRDKEKDEQNFSDPSGKRKSKIKKEEKRLEPPMKRVKQEFNPLDEGNPTCSFMVTCKNSVVAEHAKEHLRMWNIIKSVEWCQPGLPVEPASPVITIVDDVAVLQPPYL